LHSVCNRCIPQQNDDMLHPTNRFRGAFHCNVWRCSAGGFPPVRCDVECLRPVVSEMILSFSERMSTPVLVRPHYTHDKIYRKVMLYASFIGCFVMGRGFLYQEEETEEDSGYEGEESSGLVSINQHSGMAVPRCVALVPPVYYPTIRIFLT
jgi:hypothetical protein